MKIARAYVPLVLCGAVALAAAFALASAGRENGRDIGIAYAFLTIGGLCGAAIAWRSRDRTTLVIVLVVAAAIRVVLTFSPPLFSHDAYRYLWDARLIRAGFDPLALAPNASALASFRELPLFAWIDYRTIPSLYPPLAYGLFVVGSLLGDGVYGEKLVMVTGDGLAIVLLCRFLAARNLPVGRVALYAWSPLVALEVAQNGHVEAWAVAAIVAAAVALERERTRSAVVWLGAAVLIKLTPVAFVLPAFARRPRAALVCLLGCAIAYALPAAFGVPVFGSLGTYVAFERFFPTLYVLLHPLGAAIVFAGIVAAVTLVRRRALGFPEAAIVVQCAFLLCTPSALPWYAIALPALGVIATSDRLVWRIGIPAIAVATSLLPLSYGSMRTAVVPFVLAAGFTASALVVVRTKRALAEAVPLKGRYESDAFS